MNLKDFAIEVITAAEATDSIFEQVRLFKLLRKTLDEQIEKLVDKIHK